MAIVKKSYSIQVLFDASIGLPIQRMDSRLVIKPSVGKYGINKLSMHKSILADSANDFSWVKSAIESSVLVHNLDLSLVEGDGVLTYAGVGDVSKTIHMIALDEQQPIHSVNSSGGNLEFYIQTQLTDRTLAGEGTISVIYTFCLELEI